VEAIAFHHQPHHSETDGFCPLDAVHAANVIEHKIQSDLPPSSLPRFDTTHLMKKGLVGREPAWSKLAAHLLALTHGEELAHPLAA
jgi:hypothetical protein